MNTSYKISHQTSDELEQAFRKRNHLPPDNELSLVFYQQMFNAFIIGIERMPSQIVWLNYMWFESIFNRLKVFFKICDKEADFKEAFFKIVAAHNALAEGKGTRSETFDAYRVATISFLQMAKELCFTREQITTFLKTATGIPNFATTPPEQAYTRLSEDHYIPAPTVAIMVLRGLDSPRIRETFPLHSDWIKVHLHDCEGL